uniref:DUF4789 domain-containing protein n=1 Tax=Bursaphelenchus xylophilus TaxID=6326 RepID=A0A1I7SNG2_BURXY
MHRKPCVTRKMVLGHTVRFHGTWSYPRCVNSMEFMERERDVPRVNCFPSCFSPMFENVRCRDPQHSE